MAARLRNTPSGLRPFSVGPWQRALTEGAKIGNKSLKKASSPLLSTPFLSTPLLSQDLSDGKKTAPRCVAHTRTQIGPSALSLQALNYAHRVVRSAFRLFLFSLYLSIHLPLFFTPPPYLTLLQM